MLVDKLGSILIVAIDPGRLTGLATMHGLLPNESLLLVEHYCTAKSWKEVESYLLQRTNVDAVVCEDFEAFQGTRAVHQDQWMILTIKFIGRIQQWCSERRIPFILQSPTIKPLGYDISPVPATTVKDDSHWRDAIAHGAYFVNLQRGHDLARGFVLPRAQGSRPQSALPKQRRSPAKRRK